MQTVIHDITSIIGKKCIISALSGWGSGPRDWGLGVGGRGLGIGGRGLGGQELVP